MSSVRRIIVGASGSSGSLRALRYAQHLAGNLDAALVPVLAWLPPDSDLADRRTPCEELRRIWAQRPAAWTPTGRAPRPSCAPSRAAQVVAWPTTPCSSWSAWSVTAPRSSRSCRRVVSACLV